MYMPIISSSLQALNCTQPINGVRYLASDLSVVCGSREQTIGAGIAYVVLLVVGVGFPALLVFLLGRSKPAQLADPAFQNGWGFLYDGYRAENEWGVMSDELVPHVPSPASMEGGAAFAIANPLSSPRMGGPSAAPAPSTPRATAHKRSADAWMTKLFPCLFPPHLLWWESLVLLRKALIVLLAVLVTNPYFQCAGASVVLGAALSLHLLKQPFVRPVFNLLEGVTLIAAMMTAVISSTLLQYNVGDPNFVYGSPAAMSAQEWAITLMLATVNIATLSILAGSWLYFQYAAVKQTAVAAIKRRASTALALKAASLGAGKVAPGAPTPLPLPALAVGCRSMRRVFAPEVSPGTGAFANPLAVRVLSAPVDGAHLVGGDRSNSDDPAVDGSAVLAFPATHADGNVHAHRRAAAGAGVSTGTQV